MQINREALLKQIEMVTPGLSPREITEQSSCFVFKDGVVMTFNEEIACSYKCDLKIESAVSAPPLLAILRKMKENEIEVDASDGQLIIKGKRKETGIRMEMDVLLPIDTVEKPKKWIPIAEDFADAISIVQECAGTDDNYFETTCIHIHPKWVEACDNIQMCRYRLKTGMEKSILVRRTSLQHIVSLDMVEMSVTNSWIHFKNSSGMILSCRLYIEDFHDLSKIMDVTGTKINLPKGLKDAVSRSEIFSVDNPEDNHVKVKLYHGRVKVIGRGPAGYYTEIKKVKYNGDEFEFTISPKLLIALVQRHNECEVSTKRLKVDGGKFIYIVSLGLVKNKKQKKDE